MPVIADNFMTLSANARELALAIRNNEESNNLLICVTIAQGDM